MASKVVKQLAGNGAGQSLADRVNAAKFSLAGSGLGRGIIKATTEEITPPKKKHLDYLTSCTNEVNVSIPELAELLVDRTLQASWVIVLKAFITTHHLMNFGNEKFSQYMAAKNNKIYLPNFVDKTSSIGYEMSQYIKIYSKYVNEKCSTYRLMAFDFCKIKRGRDDGVLRRMPLDKLMKTLPILQGQIDVLLEFDAPEKDLTNVVLNSAFTLLYKDLIRLYASYNEGMINLIEQYFTMSRHMCRQALEMYKGFIDRTDKVNKFVTIAENAGVGDKASLGLQSVPPKVLQTLTNHLANLEKRKTSESDEEDSAAVTKKTASKVNPQIKQDIAKAAEKSKAAQPPSKPANHNQQSAGDTSLEQSLFDNATAPVSQPAPKPSAHPPSRDTSKQHKSSALDNLSGEEDNAAQDTTNTPVRTQLRRPEQQHSVTVTKQRPGRSPSPARPQQRPKSRECSPARPQQPPHSNKNDMYLNMNDTSSSTNQNVKSDNSPINGRASPFAADEKPIGGDGSFWDTVGADMPTNENEGEEADFPSAFNDCGKSNLKHQQQTTTNQNNSNLLELDLLGLADDSTNDSSANTSTTQPVSAAVHTNLDDLFALGDEDNSTSILAPAHMPIKPPQVESSSAVHKTPMDDGWSKGIASSGPTAHTGQANSTIAKAPPAAKATPTASSSGFDDTLAMLATSLGKTENKWTATPKVSTLSGKTLQAIEPTAGPTIKWNKDEPADKSSNQNDILDLFG